MTMLFNTERAAHVMALPCHRRSMELLARLSRHGVENENLGVGTWMFWKDNKALSGRFWHGTSVADVLRTFTDVLRPQKRPYGRFDVRTDVHGRFFGYQRRHLRQPHISPVNFFVCLICLCCLATIFV